MYSHEGCSVLHDTVYSGNSGIDGPLAKSDSNQQNNDQMQLRST